jgi:hypothetical protein
VTAQPGQPPAQLTADQVEAQTATAELYLEEARWLWEQQAERINRFHARSGQLLAFAGVLLALLLQAVAPIQAMQHGARRDWAFGMAIATVTCLALAAAASVASMRTVRGKGVDEVRAQESWLNWRQDHRLSPRGAASTFAQALYGKPGNSPLVSIAAEADDRAKWYTVATLLVLVGLFAIAVLVAILA